MSTKTFHLGDVLSITTERLVSPRHIDGVYDILGWMTGESLFTHQLPRACRECRSPLLAQHPDLAAIAPPEDFGGGSKDSAKDAVACWLAEQVAVYGETREVAPLAPQDHTVIDPLEEMRMMRPDGEIIIAVPDDSAPEVQA